MPSSFEFNKTTEVPDHSSLNLDHFCSGKKEKKDYDSVLEAIISEFYAMEVK